MNTTETATFAQGCFWCTEAIFLELKGVISVTPGYIGGKKSTATYQQVSSGKTEHAEAIEIIFNPEEISYETLLDVFWHTHNPTTLNRQGADVGKQYRSALFYHSQAQKKTAEKTKLQLKNQKIYSDPIVTQIVPASIFTPAEKYHHTFYKKKSQSAYCQFVITPKLKKFRERYAHLTKKSIE